MWETEREGGREGKGEGREGEKDREREKEEEGGKKIVAKDLCVNCGNESMYVCVNKRNP